MNTEGFIFSITIGLIFSILLFGGLFLIHKNRNKKQSKENNKTKDSSIELEQYIESKSKNEIKAGDFVSAILGDGSFIKGKVINHKSKYSTLAIVFNAENGKWGYDNKAHFTEDELKDSIGFKNHWSIPCVNVMNIKLLEKNENI